VSGVRHFSSYGLEKRKKHQEWILILRWKILFIDFVGQTFSVRARFRGRSAFSFRTAKAVPYILKK
jgi:hypothetical protein